MSSQPQTTQRPGPRIHRLPRRLDYILVPAPLDLSLDTMTEKSPLPAIIVTPSSPTHSKDFAIAFLAPPAKPSLLRRCSTAVSKRTSDAVSAVATSISTSIRMPGWARAGYDYAPIALPISAPATTTEFNVPAFGKARRNSRILLGVLVVFFLVLCHLLWQLFSYAIAVNTAAALAANDMGGEAVVVMEVAASTTGKSAAGHYMNKLGIQRWVGWMMSSSSEAGKEVVAAVPVSVSASGAL